MKFNKIQAIHKNNNVSNYTVCTNIEITSITSCTQFFYLICHEQAFTLIYIYQPIYKLFCILNDNLVENYFRVLHVGFFTFTQIHSWSHSYTYFNRYCPSAHWTNIGLQFLASGLSISHEIRRNLGEIHPEPYKFRCFNKNYSVCWMQERGYDLGFHEIWGHSPLHATPPKLKSFWIYKVLGGFHLKSTRFHGEIRRISKLWAFVWWSGIGLSIERPNRTSSKHQSWNCWCTKDT